MELADEDGSRNHVHGYTRDEPPPTRRETDKTIRLTVDLANGNQHNWDLEKGRKADVRSKKLPLSQSPFGPSLERFWFYSARQGRDHPTSGNTVELVAHETDRANPKQEANHVWHHVQEDGVSFAQFTDKALSLTGNDQHYQRLVRDLLDTVQRTSEKTFVHGRFLKPITATSLSKEQDGKIDRSPKRVTFFCLPFFALLDQRYYDYNKHFSGYPVRSLMQWIYRLESTKQRDAIQVPAASSSHGKVIHVPDMWALAIGKRVLLTRSSVSREDIVADTIKIRSVPERAQNHDHCVVNLVDAKNNMFYIPLNQCHTFYELMSNILLGCGQLPDAVSMHHPVRADRHFRLYNHSGAEVHERSWIDLLKKNRNSPMLRLTLRTKKGNRRRHRTGVSNEPLPPSPPSEPDTDSSSTETHRRTSATSYSSYSSRGPSDPESVGSQLQVAYRKLEEAKNSNDHEGVNALQMHQIPGLESQLLKEMDGAFLDHPALVSGNHEVKSPVCQPSEDDEDDESDEEEQQRYEQHDQRHQRRQRSKIARDNNLRERSLIGGRLSDIASLDDVEIRRKTESDSDNSSRASPVVAPVYGKFVDEGIYEWPDKRGRRRRAELDLQYIPPKKSINAALDRALGESPAMNVYKHQKGALLRVNTGNRAAPKSKHETDAVREKAQAFLRKGYKTVPFFTWPMAFTIRPDTAKRAADTTERDSDQNADSQDDTGPYAPSLDSARNNLLLSIILEDIDIRCRPTSERKQNNLGNKVLYKKARVSSMATVAALLGRSENSTQVDGKWTQFRRTFLNVTKKLLAYFVPLETDAEVVGKFWGAVYRLMAARADDVERLNFILRDLLKICELLQDLQAGSINSDGKVPSVYKIHGLMPSAFRSLLFYMIFCAASTTQVVDDHDSETTLGRLLPCSAFAAAQMWPAYNQCKNSLQVLKIQLPILISPKKTTADYHNFNLISGEDLAVMMLANLQNQMLTDQNDFLLTEIYTEYATKMQYNVSKKAGVKTYEEINRFREEIEAIKSVLNQQYHRLQDLRGVLFKPATARDQIRTNLVEYSRKYELFSPMNTVRHNMTDKLLQQVEQRRDHFDELLKQADRIQSRAAQSISLKAESNNRAIVIFTIVTVIFLPLSFVTSYFGMNTSDLRDMGSGQWIFWVIGAPLAVVVVLLTLVVGYFERLNQRLKSLVRDSGRQKMD